MGLDFHFLTTVRSWNEVSQALRRIKTKLTDKLGTMATQDKNDVDITGGTIAGTDIDVSSATLTLADNQIDVDKVGTTEGDTTKVLKPDGFGGVGWGAVSATGDVTGPAGAVDGNTVVFDGATGKLIKDFGSAPLVLGSTSATAYRGDRGTTAYDHSQTVGGNPHGVTAAEVGATDKNVAASGTDTTPADLWSKITAGSNISFTLNNAGGNETVTISASLSGGGMDKRFLAVRG